MFQLSLKSSVTLCLGLFNSAIPNPLYFDFWQIDAITFNFVVLL